MQDIWKNLLHEFQTPFTNAVLIFSVILFIILLVPIIFNRFRIPGIIGLIISGILIGPHGFFLIQKNSAVDLFSTIGLLYIMFIAGLELDLAEFKRHRNKSLLFGFLTFAVPLTIGFLACIYLFDFSVSASLLISSMFATHTLIAYPIVTRLGIVKNQAVAVAVGGTILTDTAVLILLAAISRSAQGALTYVFFTRLALSMLIFSIIVFVVIPRIASWFFRRWEDEKSAHFIFVLSVVFFCAFLAELAGLEPIIGAFASGLALNRLIPHTSSLMNRIEFVGNSLFIPFFLISVGMIIDVSVLIEGIYPLVLALTLTGVALLGKWFAATLTARAYKFSNAQGRLIFGLSSAHAAATLAVILVGYNLKIIDGTVLNATIVLILITCVVASFVTERAGKEIALYAEEVPSQPIRRQHILVPIANPDTMEKLVDFALTMKNPHDESAITCLNVVSDDDQAKTKIVQSQKMLEKVLVHAAAADSKIEIGVTIDRNVANGILRVTREKFVTDVVVGWSPDKSIADIIFGKTFDALIKKSAENVFVTNFKLPLNVHRNLLLVCPRFADKELGFYSWLDNILRSATSLRMPVRVFATAEVQTAINHYRQIAGISTEIILSPFVDPSKVEDLASDIQPEDMIIVVVAREGGISFSPLFNVLPKRMAKVYKSNSFAFIYPATTADTTMDYQSEISGGIIEKSIGWLRTFNKLFTPKP